MSSATSRSSSPTRGTGLRSSLFLLVAVLLIVSCGGEDSNGDGADSARDADPTDRPSDDASDDAIDDAPEATELPEPMDEGELPPIQITSPTAFETVVGSLTLAGSAQVHEANVQWAILGADLKPLKRGRVTASCGAPCRGTFQTRISLEDVPVGSWELHAWQANASDEGPARMHDTLVPITVADERTAGAPAADAAPPGGVPR